jgi:hypothetical protein
MIRLLSILIMSLFMSSCEAEYTPPYLHYRADFDIAKVDETEAVVKEIAKKWNLRVYEKNREEMKLHTQGKEAFFIALYFNEDAVLFVHNSGVGEVLSVMAVDHGKMPISDLGKLTAEVIGALKERLNLEFEKQKDSTASVDVGN